MTNRFYRPLLASAALIALGTVNDPAQAACSTNAPTTGQTVTCTDADTTGISSADADVVVNVADGATVTTAGDDAIALDGDDTSVTNDGIITSTGNRGIDGGGENLTVTNRGTIIGGSDALRADDDGLYLDNSGTISGGDEGVQAADDAEILNSGSITGDNGDDGRGIQIGEDGQITNSATGTITGSDHGIDADDGTSVVNRGTITGDSDDNDDGDGINGGDDISVDNSGTISGGDEGIQVGADATITNLEDGTISGLGGDAVQAEGDGLTLTNWGELVGADEGVQADGTGATVLNYGTIIGADEGMQFGDGATVTNSGYIEGETDDGIDGAADFTLVNSGTIIGNQNDGVELDNGSIVNSGTIVARDPAEEGDAGIDFDLGGGIVTNSGSIIGNVGINTTDNSEVQEIVNSGLVEGTGDFGAAAYAIRLYGGDDVLTTLTGSSIVGLIDLGDGTDTLNLLGTDSQFLNFVTLPEIFNPGDDVAWMIDGTAILSIDASLPSSFGPLFAAGAADLLGTVRRNGIGEGLWASGRVDGDHWDDGLDRVSGTLAFGYGAMLGNGMGIGAFGGAVLSDLEGDDGFDVGMNAFSAGVDVWRQMGAATVYAVLGFGHARFDYEGDVSGTSDDLDGEADGFFVTPEIGAMSELTMGARRLQLSGSVNYAGLWLDGGDVDVEDFSFDLPDQDLHYLQGRVRAAMPFALGGAATVLAPYVEVEAQASLGGDADISGVDLDLVADDVVTGKLGASLTHVTEGGARFSADLEGRFGSEGRTGLGGGLSMSVRF